MAKTHSPKPAATPKAQPVQRATFKYVFEDSYNPVYANGAHGGPTPQGEIAINFFFERNPVPLSESVAVSPDGRIIESLGKEPVLPPGTIEIIRYVTTGVILSRDTAKRVYDFLGRHLEMLEGLTAAKKGVETVAGTAPVVEKLSPPSRRRRARAAT